MFRFPFLVISLIVMLTPAAQAATAPVYLNAQNITVSVGAGTSEGSFNNTFAGGQTIAKVIDAPSAAAEEFHNQTTHIWFTTSVTGGGLELDFDFGRAYDLTTLHFWNYTAESFDVDEISFEFFDANLDSVGSLSLLPDLGSSPGIKAQDIALAAPINVSFVTAFLAGTNGQVDFQNIGFTATESVAPPPIPLPAGMPLLLAAFGALAFLRREGRQA